MWYTVPRFLFLSNQVLLWNWEHGIAMQDYQGWKYGYDLKKKEFLLDYDKSIKKPSTFYKYYALNEHSVDALTNLYVYASHPLQLNDPFDCDCRLAIIEDDQNAQALWEGLYDQISRACDTKEMLYRYSTECFTKLMFMKWGILSLTDTCENRIMWSTYANNNGFCLEWDIERFPFVHNGPFPIHYVDEVKIASSIDYDIQTLALIQSNVKQKDWKYENEWRLMIQPPEGFDLESYGESAEETNQIIGLHDRKFKYPIRALKSIVLGVSFFKDLYERQQIVSTNLYEIHVCYQKECLQTKVLDFLDRICRIKGLADLPQFKMRLKDGFRARTIKIEVIRVSSLTYRIVEIDK